MNTNDSQPVDEVMTGKRIVIAGGSGFVGRNLAKYLIDRGCTVSILSRSAPNGDQCIEPSCDWVQWDGTNLGDWTKVIDGAHGIVNCAGYSIDCVPTKENKERILRSRIDSTRALGQSIQHVQSAPRVWIQMSAVGIYGNTMSLCDESAPIGTGFLSDVCAQWESIYTEQCSHKVRSVILRLGVVLGKHSGAFPKLRALAKLGLGGAAGSGRQGMSWIHEADLNRLVYSALFDESMDGMYNGVSPNPVSNRDFMRTLRKAVGSPFGPPAPKIGVRLAARYILKTNSALALEGQFVSSRRLEEHGFEFGYPTLERAIEELVS